MKLSKHQFEEFEMDMTPMIDVVFLLILFFMLITDMTQQDLEVLTLPKARTAQPDEPDPKDFRPVVNVRQTGAMVVKQEEIFTPAQDGTKDDDRQLRQTLKLFASLMEKDNFTPGDKSTPLIPDEAVLVRADRFTPFHYVQQVMTVCGENGIQIWKVQLAAATIDQSAPGAAPAK